MATTLPDLWSIAPRGGAIRPDEVADAIRATLQADEPLDFRTRLLIRDACTGLRNFWGPSRFENWLGASEACPCLKQILKEDLGRVGFPSFTRRIMEPTRPETILRFLRDLGNAVETPTRLVLGGSGPLILSGQLTRITEDLDAVDEVPKALRGNHDLLQALTNRYALGLAHFLSRFLPTSWVTRLQGIGAFGHLQVFAVDDYDIITSKVFSRREKDRTDLERLITKIDRETLSHRVTGATRLLADPALHESASRNWYILFGEPLPGSIAS